MFGKYDFVSRAQGMLTLPEAPHPPSDEQLPLSLGCRQEAAPKDPLAGTPRCTRPEPQPEEQLVTPWDLVCNKGDISEHLGHLVATAFSSLPDAWFRSISVGTLE